MVTESTPLTKENLDFLISNIKKVNAINPAYFERYGVKRGLRNSVLPEYARLTVIISTTASLYPTRVICFTADTICPKSSEVRKKKGDSATKRSYGF